MKFIRLIDQFGVTFTPNISKDDSEFKTAFGGFMTFIIYTLSAAYSIYILQQWANGDIPPTANSSTQNLNDFNYTQEEAFIDITIRNYTDFPLNAFSKTKRYLSPFFLQMPGFILVPQDLIIEDEYSSSITLKNLNFRTNDGKFYFIGIVRCQNTTKFSQCASNEEIDLFLNQPLLKIDTMIRISEFDKKSKQISKTKVSKEQINFMDINKTIYQQANIQLSKTLQQDGVFFQSLSEYYFIADVEVQSQTLGQDIFRIATQSNLQFFYGMIIRLDQQVVVTSIVYPVAGEVIAQIGSIVSLIMLLQNLVTFINSLKLQRFLEDSIIQFYYPEFQKLKIDKNIKGEIKKVQKMNVDYDPNPLNEIYQKLRILSRQKLSILNICYEISRIQFVLQSIYPRETLEMVKNVGIKLPLIKIEPSETKKHNKIKTCEMSDTAIQVLNLELNDAEVIKKDPDILISQDFQLFMIQDRSEQHNLNQSSQMNIPNFIEKNLNLEFT